MLTPSNLPGLDFHIATGKRTKLHPAVSHIVILNKAVVVSNGGMEVIHGSFYPFPLGADKVHISRPLEILPNEHDVGGCSISRIVVYDSAEGQFVENFPEMS